MIGLKTKDVLITAEGRDQGKLFRITEMPAWQAERFAIRVFQAVARAGMEVPDSAMGAGMAALSSAIWLKAIAVMSAQEAFGLMDEMFACVQIVRDKNQPTYASPIVETDTMEVRTRFDLRLDWFELHTGFSVAELKSKLTSVSASMSKV